MTTHTNAGLGPLLERPDAAMQRLLSDLDTVCETPVPADARLEIARRLAAAAGEPAGRSNPTRQLRLPPRLTSLVAAVVLAAGGVLGYAHLQNPTPVSAAQVLRRAAAALSDIPAGSVVHEVTQVHLTVSDGPPPNDDVTYEQWTQVNRDGEPLLIDQVSRSANPALDERMVADAEGNLWTYGSAANTVTKSTWTPGKPMFNGPSPTDPQGIIFLPKEMMEAPQDPSLMRDLLTAAASGADGQMKLLDRQTINGHAVDVVQVTLTAGTVRNGFPPHWTREVYTIYLDATTYLVRRIDVKGLNDQGTTVYEQGFDVTTYDILPLKDVPAGTFTFTPSPGTRVCGPLDDSAPPGATPPCSVVGQSK